MIREKSMKKRKVGLRAARFLKKIFFIAKSDLTSDREIPSRPELDQKIGREIPHYLD